MKNKLFSGLGILLLIAVFLIVSTFVAGAGPSTLVVDDDLEDCPQAAFSTIQAAVAAASGGETIAVCSGVYVGVELDKEVHLVARGQVVINDGPNSHAFLRAGFLFPGNGAGSGASIQGFRFEGASQDGYTDDGYLDFPVFSRGADNITIEHNVMLNSLQAITNWGGNGWTIRNNVIKELWTLNGGGIGIFIGETTGGIVEDNLVSHNNVSGTLHVWPSDGGDYDGTGIVLYANFRWGNPGAEAIKNNRIVKNKVSLVSDTPSVVNVNAIELTESWYPDDPPFPVLIVIFDNVIGFNDLRGTEDQIVLTPSELDLYNEISRNLGDKRGGGAHPNVFGPGGND